MLVLVSLQILAVYAYSSNMVSYWQCEEGSGSTLSDPVSNNNGLILGATFTDGIVGNALLFNGSNYVSIPDNSSLKPSHLTVEAWIYIDQLPTSYPGWSWPGWAATFISKCQFQGAAGDAGYLLQITVEHDGELAYLEFALGSGAGFQGWSSAKSPKMLQTGVWYHVAGTYDGTLIKVFINGVEAGSIDKVNGAYPVPDPDFELVHSNTPFEIGGHYQLTGVVGLERTFKGKIDEIAFYNEALTVGVINAHYLQQARAILSSFDMQFAANDVKVIYPSDSPTKPLGCVAAWVSDWTASAFVTTKLQNYSEGLDINSNFVNQTTGTPEGASGQGIISFGGPVVNPVVKYAESSSTSSADRAPIKFTSDAGTFYFQHWNESSIPGANLPVSVINNDQDMFAIEVYKDGNGTFMMLCYGFGWKGTYAAGKYFDTAIYPDITSYNIGWIIVKWQDTNGDSFVNNPSDGDTYTIIASGT